MGTGIFNGDVGVIQEIDPGGELVTIRFDDRTSVYTPDLLGQLDMAYAMTVHKAQGSEYRAVVLVSAPAAASLMVRGAVYRHHTGQRAAGNGGDDVIPEKWRKTTGRPGDTAACAADSCREVAAMALQDDLNRLQKQLGIFSFPGNVPSAGPSPAAACCAAAAKGPCPIPGRTPCVRGPSGGAPRRCTIPAPSGRLSFTSSFRAAPAGWTASAD